MQPLSILTEEAPHVIFTEASRAGHAFSFSSIPSSLIPIQNVGGDYLASKLNYKRRAIRDFRTGASVGKKIANLAEAPHCFSVSCTVPGQNRC